MHLGFQAPKQQRVKRFNYIHIKGDLHYCDSHNFMYNTEEESCKLHDGKPCIYTDDRFTSGNFNYYKSCYLHFSRYSKHMYGKSISLKAALRKVKSCKNIPIDTIVEFNQDWSIGETNNSFLYKIIEENKEEIVYGITIKSFKNLFNNNKKANDLIILLRKNGFLVSVFNNNPGFLIGDEPGGIAIAYGNGIRIGFSTDDNTFRGYTNGEKNILWNSYDDFDKWSSCYEIPKSLDNKEIVKQLLNCNKEK